MHTRDGVKPAPLQKGIVPTIPLRALVPKDSKNIMVAGRSVSSDRLANSGLRVQASCMAMGQAAGVTTALSAQHDTTPLQVPIEDIRKILKKHGAIVPSI
ncbi:MAG TPA: FAD-dependent oxidoreductase [Anaerolineae bacterium]|nr:FAD-dependent oxidoreductase [Anaerolineae bacterium]